MYTVSDIFSSEFPCILCFGASYNLILTLSMVTIVLLRVQEACCCTCIPRTGREQELCQSTSCLLTFFFWGPLIIFEKESWLQPFLGELAWCDGRFISSPEVSSPGWLVCSASLLYGCHNRSPVCGLIGEDLHVC